MISGIYPTHAIFPSQLVSDKEKQTDKWQKDSLDGSINRILYVTDLMRKQRVEKIENYNIVYGKFDLSRLQKHLDPLNLNGESLDESLFDNTDSYAILLAPLNTIWGEELKRSFDPRAIVVNPEAISVKEREIKDKINAFLENTLKMEKLSEEEVQKQTEDLIRWKTYDAQSIHERLANNVLQHYYPKLDVKHIFNAGWKDLTIVGEEIYYIGNANGEPYIRKCNPLQIMYYGNGQSNRIEDATMIVEWGYYSVGSILNEFNRDLKTSTDLEKLEKYLNYGTSNAGTFIKTAASAPFANLENVLLPTEQFEPNPFFFNWYDRQGNIIVVRVTWLSQRKIGDLKYYDENGDEQHKFVPEQYKVNKDKGEEIDWFYINEWWQGVKIGADIYVQIKPLEVQMRSVTNPCVCRPPYVGFITNINSGKVFSLVDSVKELAYEYIVYAKKLKHLWLTNLGKIARIDMSRIPNGMMEDGSKWTIERWIKFIKLHRMALENPFQEDNKGHIAGNMQGNSGHLDMSASDEIRQCLEYLNYIESRINSLMGINAQRQGDISSTEAVTNVQQAVVYSATQTEPLFSVHDETKLRVMRVFLETAKYCLKDKKELRQHILDDQEIALLEIDGDVLFEAEYDVQILNSRKVLEFENAMKGLFDRALQSGTVTLSDVGMAYMANSPSTLIGNLKNAEEKRLRQQQELQKQQMELQQQMQERQMQAEEAKQAFELKKMEMKFAYDSQLKQMDLQDKARADAFNQFYTDANNNGVEDNIELEKQELVNADKEKDREFQAKEAEKQRKFEAEQKEKDRLNKLKEIAAKPKVTTSKK